MIYEVVPLVGTWIEIGFPCWIWWYLVNVVPLVGTWIEIMVVLSININHRRAPRGHVD